MTNREERAHFFIRAFGGTHGGAFRATNTTDTPDGWRCWGKPLVIDGLSRSAATKQARDLRRAGYVVRIARGM